MARLAMADAAIAKAIADKQIPGAVLLVGRGDQVLYQKAYGMRSLVPQVEPMTLDTVFDMASVTKVVATTTSVMMLVEDGKIRLNDRVATFIPDFGRHGKGDITIRHLLTHVSGLRPDLDLSDDSWRSSEEAIRRACEEVPTSAPGERLVYSDINFFLLAEIVSRVAGMPFERFVQERLAVPLGMRDTMFNPPASLKPRIAPTEMCTPYGWPCEGPNQVMLRGIVHDPTARRMGGVAGHAGLFSTAADLARYCRMVLGGGALGTTRILSPLTVLKMTSPATPAGMANVRALGWDLDSSYSSNRGELFPVGSFGHTGWTGTSVWMDPLTKTYVILLSNRVHPDGKGDAGPVRARVATIVASALRQLPDESVLRAQRWTGTDFAAAGTAPRRADEADGRTLNGIDVLRADGFALLRGKKVGLITNHTGRARTGEATIDLIAGLKDVTLVALFSPEHGIRGIVDEQVDSSKDEKTGLPIYSLYGATNRPTDDMLKGIDTLVVDLQDIGARFYTYTTTMGYVMEEAAKRKIAVVVLDRPNPVNGASIEGPTVDRERAELHGLLPDAGPPRDDAGRAGAALQCREEDRRRPHRRRDEALGPRQLVRPDRADVGQPVAEHAEHGGGQPLPGHRRDRGVEPVGRARHRLAVRAVRRAVDRRPAAGGRAQPAEPAGGPVLSAQLHAHVEPVCQRALPRRLHHRHRPGSDAARARRRGGRVRPLPAVPRAVRGGQGGEAVRRRHREANPGRRRPGGHRHGLGAR